MMLQSCCPLDLVFRSLLLVAWGHPGWAPSLSGLLSLPQEGDVLLDSWVFLEETCHWSPMCRSFPSSKEPWSDCSSQGLRLHLPFLRQACNSCCSWWLRLFLALNPLIASRNWLSEAPWKLHLAPCDWGRASHTCPGRRSKELPREWRQEYGRLRRRLGWHPAYQAPPLASAFSR